MAEVVTGDQIKQFFEGGLASLAEHQKEIDRLNVFPVPDGDTGRNMYLTLLAAVKELNNVEQHTAEQVTEALARGSLMGARGNSGVILSQLIRGMAEPARGKEELTVPDFVKAWQVAVSTAYQAVIKPVEGTMLTVARGFSQGLNEAADYSNDWQEVIARAIIKGNETLQLTPTMLVELKRAGVVDSGGKGLMVILEGGLNAVRNGMTVSQPSLEAFPEDFVDEIPETDADFTYLYCTSLLLSGNVTELEKVKTELAEMGGSMVIGATGDLVKLHIHSNNPGRILEYMSSLGTLHNVEVSNMHDQWEEAHGGTACPERKPAEACNAATMGSDEIGIVAVATGEGIVQLFTNLGVHHVIAGGQTMNPPVEEFVHAIENLSVDRVIILPNNKNLILAAEQAKNFVHKQVEIVPSKSIPDGIAAMLAFSADGSLNENRERMTTELAAVKAGEITYAVRDANIEGSSIKEGELIGLYQDKVVVSGQDLDQLVVDLVNKMAVEGDELVTLFSGSDVEESAATRIAERLRSARADLEVESHSGGQPVYYYLISVE